MKYGADKVNRNSNLHMDLMRIYSISSGPCAPLLYNTQAVGLIQTVIIRFRIHTDMLVDLPSYDLQLYCIEDN